MTTTTFKNTNNRFETEDIIDAEIISTTTKEYHNLFVSEGFTANKERIQNFRQVANTKQNIVQTFKTEKLDFGMDRRSNVKKSTVIKGRLEKQKAFSWVPPTAA